MPKADTRQVDRLLQEYAQRTALRGGNPYRAKVIRDTNSCEIKTKRQVEVRIQARTELERSCRAASTFCTGTAGRYCHTSLRKHPTRPQCGSLMNLKLGVMPGAPK